MLSMFVLVPVTAQATQLKGISVTPATAKVGEEVKITVSGDVDNANCGIRMEYGGGLPNDDFALADKGGQLPLTLTKTYPTPGTYKVKALARKVGFTFGCGEGGVETTLTVVAAAGAKAAASGAAAACPEGWDMKPGGSAAKGFTCAPKKPAGKLECGPGLTYFEKDGLIGCKAGKKK
jgi:hypothetical protein